MTQPNWHPLATAVALPAKPAGLWTKVWDYISGPRKLRVKATGDWKLRSGACSPDGDRSETLASPALVPSALPGALIGKIGGSPSDIPPTLPAGSAPPPSPPAPMVFAAGTFCIVDVPAGMRGALFFTMNDHVDGFDQHDGSITLDIDEAL